MTDANNRMRRVRLGASAAALLLIGVAGGAGAVSLTRPSIEMAPTLVTAIGKLSDGSGIVTVKGRIVEVFGDRFVIQDQSGRAMIDAGRRSAFTSTTGQVVTVQGRYHNGQMHASYMIDANGRVTATGPTGRPLRGPGAPDQPHRAAPPPADGPGHADGPPPPSACDTARSAERPAAPGIAPQPQ